MPKRVDEAFNAFYKVSWSNEQQEMSFYYLACIEAGRGNYEETLQMADKGLVKNAHNVKAQGLRTYLLRKLGKTEQAAEVLSQCSEAWPLLFYYKVYYLGRMTMEEGQTLLQALQCSTDYCFPNKREAILVLEYAVKESAGDANACYYQGNLYYDKMQYETAIQY